METFSRLARRAAHLLTLEVFALALLVYPLQMSAERLETLRAWFLSGPWAGALRQSGVDPASVWRFDLSAIINSGFDPLVLKEGLMKATVVLALVVWLLSHITRAAAPEPRRLPTLRLVWLVVAVAVITGSFFWGTGGFGENRHMVWLQARTCFSALAGLAFLMMLGDLVRCRRVGERWVAALFVLTTPIVLIALLQHLGDQILPPDRYQWLGLIPLARDPMNTDVDLSRNIIGSLIGHNNGAALVCVPGLCLAPGVWARSRRRWLRGALVLWVFLAAWVVLRSHSRSVYLALALGAAIWSLLRWAALPRRGQRLIGPGARRWLLAGVVLFLALQTFPNPLRAVEGLGPRMRRLIDASDLLTDTRMRTLVCGLPAFRDRFFTGWGIGSFTWVYPPYQGRHFTSPENLDTRLAPTALLTNAAHNDWLQLAIEMGLAGLLVGVWGVALWWGRGWRFLRGGTPALLDGALVSGLLCAGIIWMLQSGFDFPMRVVPTALMGVVLLALAGNAPEIWGPPRFAAAPPLTGGRRALRWVAALLVLAWCVWPPRWWVGPPHSMNPSAMAPSLSLALRPLAGEVMADARHVLAQSHMQRYYTDASLRGTPEGFAMLAEARAQLRAALMIDPANGEIRHHLGEVLTHLGAQNPALCEAAIEELTAAMDEVRNYTSFYYIGECHHTLSVAFGEQALQAAAEGDSARAEELRQRQAEHWRQAQSAYLRALMLNPADPYSADTLAKMYLQEGAWRDAVGIVRTMRHWRPDWYRDRWVRDTVADLDMGRFERALQRLRVITAVEPDAPEYLAMAADAYLRLGDLTRAQATIDELHRRFAREHLFDHLDVLLLVAQGQLGPALERAREVHAQTGARLLLYLEHLLLRRLGRTDEAQRVYAQVVAELRAEGRAAEEADFFLGTIAWERFSDPETAEMFYRRIAEDPPGPPTLVWYRLAERAHERGDSAEALGWLERMSEAQRAAYPPAEALWRDLRAAQ